VSAEVTGLPNLQQQEEPFEASKLINLRSPTAETPLELKTRRQSNKPELRGKYLNRKG
jgi:hypothetical protein